MPDQAGSGEGRPPWESRWQGSRFIDWGKGWDGTGAGNPNGVWVVRTAEAEKYIADAEAERDSLRAAIEREIEWHQDQAEIAERRADGVPPGGRGEAGRWRIVAAREMQAADRLTALLHPPAEAVPAKCPTCGSKKPEVCLLGNHSHHLAGHGYFFESWTDDCCSDSFHDTAPSSKGRASG